MALSKSPSRRIAVDHQAAQERIVPILRESAPERVSETRGAWLVFRFDRIHIPQG
jgi:hypothetical protein